MKLKTLIICTLAACSSMALASEGMEKENVRITFHNRIDASASDQATLEDQMKQLYENPSAQLPEVKTGPDHEQMVSDFIDVEVHWGGKHEKIVDRRMNSVDGLTVELKN